MSDCVYILDILFKAKPKKRKRILNLANFVLLKSIVECIKNALKSSVKLKK